MTTIQNQAVNAVTNFFEGYNLANPVKVFNSSSEIAKDGNEVKTALGLLKKQFSIGLKDGWKVIAHTDLKVTEGEFTLVVEYKMIAIPA